jgi:hypothetical protein
MNRLQAIRRLAAALAGIAINQSAEETRHVHNNGPDR